MPGAVGGVSTFYQFQTTLENRLVDLACESKLSSAEALGEAKVEQYFLMPIGLLLVVDEENGGDVTAQQLIKGFHLLDRESASIIDFYFLGWDWLRPTDHSKGLRFDLRSFDSCRQVLKGNGIKLFGSTAELILVDVHFWCHISLFADTGIHLVGGRRTMLNFSEAIHVNLSRGRDDGDIPPIAQFFHAIIQATEDVRLSAASADAIVFSVSDKLGLATAKQSFLEFVFDKWGKFIGAKTLAHLAVRNIGPQVNLDKLTFDASSSDRT